MYTKVSLVKPLFLSTYCVCGSSSWSRGAACSRTDRQQVHQL